MSSNHQFSIAVHILAGLGYQGCDSDLSSGQLAKSVNANPSFVRRVLARLSKAGLVRTTTGKNGCCKLAKPAASITLLDIYEAVEAPHVFSIHSYEDQKTCKVSCHIKSSMEKVLERTQKAMEASLKEVRLSDVISDLKKKDVKKG
jgi:Rrf2 family protein